MKNGSDGKISQKLCISNINNISTLVHGEVALHFETYLLRNILQAFSS